MCYCCPEALVKHVCINVSAQDESMSVDHPASVLCKVARCFCKNTGLFVNSDKNIIIEKIIETRHRPSCSHKWTLRIQTQPIHIFAIGDSNNDWGKKNFRENNHCTLMAFTMKTALCEQKFKKTLNQGNMVRLTKNAISQSLFFTQRSISPLVAAMSFSSCPFFSDYNSACVGFTVDCQKNARTDHV